MTNGTDGTSKGEGARAFAARVSRRLDFENETLFDPAFFAALGVATRGQERARRRGAAARGRAAAGAPDAAASAGSRTTLSNWCSTVIVESPLSAPSGAALRRGRGQG